MTTKYTEGFADTRTVRVREVAESIQYGHTASAVTSEEGPRFLRITDIQNGAVDWDQVPSCDIAQKEIPEYRLSEGDLVFARTGATTGKSYLIRKCPDAVFASYLIRVRASKDVDPRYLALFFQSPDYWSQIEKGKRGIGQPNVNGKILGEVKLPLPPLHEQERIVAEIEKQSTRLDAGVASLKRVQVALKRYRASVLKAACEGRLVPTEAELARRENRRYESGEQLLQRILKERREKWNGKGKYKEPATPNVDLPTLPEGWAWASFDQITSLITKGSSPRWQGFEYSDSGVVFVRSENVRWGYLDLRDIAHLPVSFNEKEKKSVLRAGDVLLNLVGASIGRAAVATDDVHGGNTNQAVAVIRTLLKRPLNHFAVLWLISAEAQRLIHAEKVDVARANFSLEDTRVLPIPLPPLAEQQRIVAELEWRFSVIEELEAASLDRTPACHASSAVYPSTGFQRVLTDRFVNR